MWIQGVAIGSVAAALTPHITRDQLDGAPTRHRWCDDAHQQCCAVRFSTSMRVILAERKLYTDLCANSQNFS